MATSDKLVSKDTPILTVVRHIDSNRKGAVVVIGPDHELVGVVTDGDIRRAVLSGFSLDQPVMTLVERRSKELYPIPLFLPIDSTPEAQIALMQEHKIRHLPLVGSSGRVVDLIVIEDLLAEPGLPLRAVVMAGGFGKRLWPLTETLPKPMLPVNGKPMMQRLVEQLRDAGIHNLHVTTHYKPEVIRNHFGDGGSFGVEIEYFHESRPLGTAGALGLMPRPVDPILVVNGDVLTSANFKAMLHFHEENQAALTMGVSPFETPIPYGVVQLDGSNVTAIAEKPVHRCFINAGIYLLSPEVFEYVPNDGRAFDMPDLVKLLLGAKRRVISFPIREYWLDVGLLQNYEKAQVDSAEGKISA